MVEKTDLLETQDFKKIIDSSQSFLILLPTNPSFDQVAAALALHLSLQNLKKFTHLSSARELPENYKILPSSDSIMTEVGNQSLQISFPYAEESVENVSYNIDEQASMFRLVIRPRKGARSIDPQQVEYAHVGIDADTIIMVGINSYDQIKDLYEAEQRTFHQANTIAISSTGSSHAQQNYTTQGSYTQTLFNLIKSLEVEVKNDTATVVLAGIEAATDGFRKKDLRPEVFELAAELLRNGAERLNIKTEVMSGSGGLAAAFANRQAAMAEATQPEVDDGKPPQLQRVDEPGKQSPFMPSNYSPPAK